MLYDWFRNSRHLLNQSDPKLKTIVRVFPRFSKVNVNLHLECLFIHLVSQIEISITVLNTSTQTPNKYIDLLLTFVVIGRFNCFVFGS